MPNHLSTWNKRGPRPHVQRGSSCSEVLAGRTHYAQGLLLHLWVPPQPSCWCLGVGGAPPVPRCLWSCRHRYSGKSQVPAQMVSFVSLLLPRSEPLWDRAEKACLSITTPPAHASVCPAAATHLQGPERVLVSFL
ncbi:hypothetical protein mRhiFer1_009285 [Rhinolophus ferrumequinum]|uniref:Uncharacterized protein n=1 Tax=Rhinolophus ferrumequinum TaxID=59479 RepID=A0A7J7RXQ1_RHIFE|nr:hypothetical protein mRhiFer1_009285 [Rhinolophus ferrumequinum]